MAAMTQTEPAPSALPPATGRAGFGGTLRSELTKIRSVRSTYWTLLVLLAVSVGIGAAITGGTAAGPPTTTCCAWPRPTTCPSSGWARRSIWSA